MAMRDPAIEGPFRRFTRKDRHQWPRASCISACDDLSQDTAVRPTEIAACSSWVGMPVAEIGDASPRPLIKPSDFLQLPLLIRLEVSCLMQGVRSGSDHVAHDHAGGAGPPAHESPAGLKRKPTTRLPFARAKDSPSKHHSDRHEVVIAQGDSCTGGGAAEPRYATRAAGRSSPGEGQPSGRSNPGLGHR